MTEENSRLQIVRVDPHDEDALRAWHTTYLEADTRGRPFATPWVYEEARATAQAPPVANERVFLSGLVDGDVVCVAQVVLPLKDNLDHVDFHVHTHPDHRRRGYATAMLAHVEALGAQRGRTHLVVMVDHPYDLGATGAGEPGVEFLRAHGFTHSLGEVQSACPLPVRGEVLDELVTEAAAHHEGYTLRSFVDRCPDDLLVSFGRAMGMLVTEAPTGTLQYEPEVFDEERIRSQEAMMAEAGRTGYFTVALDRSDDVVAYTQLVVPRFDPGRAYQWGTLVHPAHRGHRLGLAVKAVNLRLLQENESDLSSVITYNAEVNDHMIAVNRRFGFEPVARSAELEKVLSV
jgi:GNAT superfamily N-acetyltransferase